MTNSNVLLVYLVPQVVTIADTLSTTDYLYIAITYSTNALMS